MEINGSGLLKKYNNSLSNALCDLYPEWFGENKPKTDHYKKSQLLLRKELKKMFPNEGV